MLKINNEECLLVKIDLLRAKMIHTGMEEGLSSKKTIELSEELDFYLMQYQQLYQSTTKSLHN